MASHYDDTRLFKLFGELRPPQRRKAVKGALRQSANAVAKAARLNLSEEIEASSEVLKGIRGTVYKRTLGFRVTVGTKKKAKSRKEIVPLWMQGTEDRYRGSRRKAMKALRRLSQSKKGYTGRLAHRTFMEKTQTEALPQAAALIREKLIKTIERTAKKYGCTV